MSARALCLFLLASFAAAAALVSAGCIEPPQPVEVPATVLVEVTREVSVVVETEREVPLVVEVERNVPVTVEVEREVMSTVEVPVIVERLSTVEVPVIVEKLSTVEVPYVVEVPVTVEVEVTREVEVIREVEAARLAEAVQPAQVQPAATAVLEPTAMPYPTEVPPPPREVIIEVQVEVTRVVEVEVVERTTNRLATIKQQRGFLICATGNDTAGFHSLDRARQSIGFDVDLCRAVAAAVLGDAGAVEYFFISPAESEAELRSGSPDLVSRTITVTSRRDTHWGNFAPVMFYDGQGFITRKESGVTSALELRDAAICVTAGTTTELNLVDYSLQNNLNFALTSFLRHQDAVAAYFAGECDAFTTDRSTLALILIEFHLLGLPNLDDHVILPEIISEEPLAPAVPHGDEAWFDVVKIVMAGLIYAEAYGIDSSNVDAIAAGDNFKARRLLGTEGDFGQDKLGLNKTFMQDVIKQVGNYGEIYERNLGADGIGLPRKGRNDLWINGGQIYAAPLR